VPRILTVAGCQTGPIQRADSRASVVERLVALLRRASAHGARLAVFPELALTTFFPRWYTEDAAELDRWYERAMPNPSVQPLFDEARRLKIGFYLGYAELTPEGRRYNTAILVDETGTIVGKYRKVHLPGHAEYEPKRPWQHLEKRYFLPGDLGFPVWRMRAGDTSGVMGMAICNDRRWPETYRVMGMQGVEMIMLGYNTPAANAVGTESHHLRVFHNHLVMQSGAYQNGTWVIGVAKAGTEDAHEMIGASVIVAPSGEIVAQARTLGDEVIVAEADLDECTLNKTTIFNFAAHRRIEHYGIITSQTGATPPP
jgi:predicted amidohydrolase